MDSIYLTGSKTYDEQDDDWACNEFMPVSAGSGKSAHFFPVRFLHLSKNTPH